MILVIVNFLSLIIAISCKNSSQSGHESEPEFLTVADSNRPMIDGKSYRSRMNRVLYMFCNKPDITEEMVQEFLNCDQSSRPTSGYISKCEEEIFKDQSLLSKRNRICLRGDETMKMLKFCLLKERVKLATMARSKRPERSAILTGDSDLDRLDQVDQAKLIEILGKIYENQMRRLDCMEQALQLDP